MAKKTTRQAARRKTTKKAAQGNTVLYIRNLPTDVAAKIKTVAKARRQTTAGVIMDLVRNAGDSFENNTSW